MIESVFLDRDGVINERAADDDYVTSWSGFRFLPGALDALRLLADAGVRVIVLTNQRGIARGRMTEQDLADIHRQMREAVTTAGGRIDAVYHCPHDVGACDCRKPRIGLYRQAQHDFPDIRLEASVSVGDSVSDIEAAVRAGSRAFLVTSGERGARLLAESLELGLPVAGTGTGLQEIVVARILPSLAGVGSSQAAG